MGTTILIQSSVNVADKQCYCESKAKLKKIAQWINKYRKKYTHSVDLTEQTFAKSERAEKRGSNTVGEKSVCVLLSPKELGRDDQIG